MIIDEVKQTVAQKQQSYKHPKENFRDLAIGWSVIAGVTLTDKQVALMFEWHKILRENYKHDDDNIRDGYGYWACLEMLYE